MLDGVDVSSKGAERAHRGLRRTFQRVQTFGWLTVEDNVLTALEWRGGGGGFVADLVGFPTRGGASASGARASSEVLELCGLVDVRDEHAGSLPIGIARMVELARAIVDSPKLLLLDEPASGLDETEAERLGEQIQAVRDETGCAVVLVEHNAGFVMEHCDRVVVLNLGRCSPRAARRDPANPAVRAAYLGEVHATPEPATATARNDDTHRARERGPCELSTSSGLVTGAIYSIMASGLVLTYTTSGIFNFAHGAIAFTTAYLYSSSTPASACRSCPR